MTDDTSARVRLRLALTSADIGARVMMRHLLPDGRATDVLGRLELWGAPSPGSQPQAAVRRGDGRVITVPIADVVAGHRIPPPPLRARASDVEDLELEDIAAVGWQAPDNRRVGGWLLRAAGGFTGRANSVLALGDPGPPLDEALAMVSSWYAERALPPRFQVPLPALAGLDEALAARGWTAYNPTDVLVADIAEVLSTADGTVSDPAVDIADAPSAGWLGAYHYRGGALPAGALGLFSSAPVQAFATVTEAGAAIAVGRVALGRDGSSRRWAGLTALEVVPAARRRGLGSGVVRALLDWAAQRGARHAYLQVAAENAAAHAAYGRAGFVRHHGYHYRLAPPPRTGGSA